MTFEQLEQKMQALGYRWQENRRDDANIGYFYRRIETKRPCICNDKDQILIDVWDYRKMPVGFEPPQRYSLTAEITGEHRADRWTKLQTYGLSPDQFFQNEAQIVSDLIAAWEALAPVK